MFQTIVDGERSAKAHDKHSQANAQGGSERHRVRSFQFVILTQIFNKISTFIKCISVVAPLCVVFRILLHTLILKLLCTLT